MGNANATADYLTDKVVVIPMKVGEEGRLFGSVTAPMVAQALKEQHDIEIDRRKIEIRTPIKELGDHPVDINVYRDLKAPVNVKVVGDGEAVDIGMTAEEAAHLSEDAPAEVVADELREDAENITFEGEEVAAPVMPGQEELLAEAAPVAEVLVENAEGEGAE